MLVRTGDMNIPAISAAVTPVLHRSDVTCNIQHRQQQQQRHVLDAGSRLG